MGRMTHTYTLVEMELSQEAYEEILGKLQEAGYDHAIGHDGMLDMTHIGITKTHPTEYRPLSAEDVAEALEGWPDD